jgi:formylmethanofuran dehydrogenase subunit C
MSSLTLTLRQLPGTADVPLAPRTAATSAKRGAAARLDLRGIVPDRLSALTVGEIGQLSVAYQSQLLPLEQLFDVEDGARDKLVLKGDLRQVDNVAGTMRDGMLVVEGSVGNGLASDMRGGHVIVTGDAGDYVAVGMRNGYVDIGGRVLDYCAGARPGTRRGMRGGVLRVGGSAGRFLGYRMRRGTVIVAGDIDEACASSLIAGTLICLGNIAPPLGIGMRRGTLISLSASPPPLHPGFTPPEPIRLSFLYLVLDALRAQLPDVDVDRLAQQPMWRSLGDRASDGKAELLWPVSPVTAESGQ